MKLNELLRPEGRPPRKRKRLGRGDATGRGGTAGRGHKGQKSRAGGFHKVGFEGGQMPLQRRLPKRGFTNVFQTRYAIVNVDELKVFPPNTEITWQVLRDRGIVRKRYDGLKILGRGELTHALTVKARAFSAAAKAKIEAAGGRVEACKEVIRG